MAVSPSEHWTARRQRLRERRHAVLRRIAAGLEALQAAGVSAALVLPLSDDQPVEILVEATDMPAMSLAARVLRRSMGDVAHRPVFTGDLTPERLAVFRGSTWSLETVRQHTRGRAA